MPAPMVRVKEGTKIVASIANQMDVPLVVHGLCARDAGRCSPLSVPAGDTRSTEFSAGRPGTYHYWATAMGAPVPFRELAGAFIVDPAEGSASDRVLVITEWTSLSPAQLGESCVPTTRRSVRQAEAATDVRDERPVVAGYGAVHLFTRRAGPLARHQPQFAASPNASARVLL